MTPSYDRRSFLCSVAAPGWRRAGALFGQDHLLPTKRRRARRFNGGAAPPCRAKARRAVVHVWAASQSIPSHYKPLLIPAARQEFNPAAVSNCSRCARRC